VPAQTFAEAADAAARTVEKHWPGSRAIVIWSAGDGVEAVKPGVLVDLGSLDMEGDDVLAEALERLGGAPDQAAMSVPLLVGGRREGLICLLGISEAMGKVEYGLLEGIASLLATIRDRDLEYERLAEEAKTLHHEARTDPLTGLLNRRGFLLELERHFEHSKAPEFADVLLLADIQGLKKANDRYGHGVGDQLLIDVGEALRATALSQDAVGRFGGDEFVVVICGEAAARRADAYATGVRRYLERLSDLRPTVLNVAFGGQELSGLECASQAFEFADNAMFKRGS
jgi:diguanylate cyclase (GGDEF)-like protein